MPSYHVASPQKRLRLHLIERDLTLAWLCRETGVSGVTLSGVFTGRVRATPRIRALVAEALGVPSGSIFTDIADPTDEERADAEKWEQFDQVADQLRGLLIGAAS